HRAHHAPVCDGGRRRRSGARQGGALCREGFEGDEDPEGAEMKSSAKSPDEYVKSLPADRREAIGAVRAAILKNLPKGFEEMVDFGMLAYVVPLKRLPDTYNGHPLPIAALASQKNYMSVYLMCVYGNAKLKAWFAAEFKKAGKKLDMGKS